MYSKNPLYNLQGEFNGVKVYTLVKETDYHMVRYVEAMNWQTYASTGMSKQKIETIADELIRMCNEEKPRTIITDVAAIAQVMKYSLKYPFDEHCAINIGAVLSFVEYEENGHVISEDPKVIDPLTSKKKLELAHSNPDAYAFFLSWGVSNTPEYSQLFDTSIASDYLIKRKEAMMMLLPEHLKHLMNS